MGVAEQTYQPEEVDGSFFAVSDLLAKSDSSVQGKTRGKANIGGLLSPLDSQGSETRPHFPLQPSIPSNMEFSGVRKKKSIGDRLAEITKLKESIKQQRLELERERIKSNQRLRRSIASRASLDRLSQTKSSPSTPKVNANESVSLIEHDIARDTDKDRLEMQKIEELEVSPSRSIVISDEETELLQKERGLNVEIAKAERNLNYAENDQIAFNDLKDKQREIHSIDRSRDIERRRRHLTSDEAKKTGPPPEDAKNVYDLFATRLQAALRGWITRCWFKWYKVNVKCTFNFVVVIMHFNVVDRPLVSTISAN